MNAVDTNVFVYARDDDDLGKQAKADMLLGKLLIQRSETVMLWQVACEFLNCLRRWENEGRITSTEVEEDFRDILAMFPVRRPALAIFDHSFQLRSRFSLSHWDSLLLAACKEAGVETLYSEDLSPTTNCNGVSVINPFA